MLSKKFLAVFVISVLVFAVAVQAQENNLVENVNIILRDLTQILGGVGRILANPAVIINGELGANVDEIVSRIGTLVNDLGGTVNDLLLSLGLAQA